MTNVADIDATDGDDDASADDVAATSFFISNWRFSYFKVDLSLIESNLSFWRIPYTRVSNLHENSLY